MVSFIFRPPLHTMKEPKNNYNIGRHVCVLSHVCLICIVTFHSLYIVTWMNYVISSVICTCLPCRYFQIFVNNEDYNEWVNCSTSKQLKVIDVTSTPCASADHKCLSFILSFRGTCRDLNCVLLPSREALQKNTGRISLSNKCQVSFMAHVEIIEF